MTGRRGALAVLIIVPPLILAVAGLFHPMVLNPETGARWRNLHLALLPVFPFLALGPPLAVLRESLALRVIVGLLGFGYAVYYTALDVLAGVGAGALQLAGHRPEASVLFTEGNRLARYGVWCYLAAAVLAAGASLIRSRARAVPGAVLVVAGAVSFLDSHIYWPRGVLTMLVLAAGWAWLYGVQAQNHPAGLETARA